ncbi:MAG: hypothetical protein MUF78_05225 [Candidatus Edwardsbacteria bacterium]|nr:hypothetical protein [Candidatus Edwardsbacteria bacterium]
MKTRLTLLIAITAMCAVCIFTAVCFAQKRARIGIVPVCASTFMDTLDNVIWGDTVLSLSDARRIKVKGIEDLKLPSIDVKYPKVVFVVEKKKYDSDATQEILKAIQFIDIAGHIKKELKENPNDIDFGNINVSKNKKFICLTTWTRKKFMTKVRRTDTGIIEDCEAPLHESRIYNTDGILLRVIKHRNSYSYVSPNGEYIVGSGAFGVDDNVTVYNVNGLVAEIIKTGSSWEVDFSDDGGWFAVTVRNVDNRMLSLAKTREEKDRARMADLIVMDKNGNVLWSKKNIAYGSASAVVVVTTCMFLTRMAMS